jgi:hypothetical protein
MYLIIIPKKEKIRAIKIFIYYSYFLEYRCFLIDLGISIIILLFLFIQQHIITKYSIRFNNYYHLIYYFKR